MQIYIEHLISLGLVAASIIFTVYLLARMCTGGPRLRPERRGGVPREGDLTSTQAAYGAEVSYFPGSRAGAAGPFPVGGKQERAPTRSFRSYTDPRRKESGE